MNRDDPRGFLVPFVEAPPPTDADRERWRREEAQAKAWRRMVREQDGHLVAPNIDAEDEDDEPEDSGPLPGQYAMALD